ncbi:hypothetical protein [Actinoplanes aureus]|uniref:Uncharacterized protein n=1 Tax=Actinoplanes aureus TaxID=2792083 RepID=A0A931G8J3_9ACTN|nr:hypothetical protein [Actinoplanes aureus]MBG0569309.1 hypothetical protein [Actinoplanes aureus]
MYHRALFGVEQMGRAASSEGVQIDRGPGRGRRTDRDDAQRAVLRRLRLR